MNNSTAATNPLVGKNAFERHTAAVEEAKQQLKVRTVKRGYLLSRLIYKLFYVATVESNIKSPLRLFLRKPQPCSYE